MILIIIVVLAVATCNDESIELNSIINVKVESKKLRLSQAKCFKIHISKKPDECLSILKAHEKIIGEASSASYLGDILNENGTIDDTVNQRRNKSIGIINQVRSILTSVSLGFYYFDIALILRESMLVNGILTNAEVWYNTKEEHLTILESADIELMRILFNAHSKTATELFFLETGKIPLRFTISKRRLLYLWTILTRGEEELTSKVYQAQKVKKTRGDWYVMIQEEKKKYEITLSDEEISDLSKNKFKSYVEKKVNTFALKHLKAEAAKHSKSLGILTDVTSLKKWRRQSYLNENIFSKEELFLLFQLRSRMLDVKSNFSTLYERNLVCRTCKEEDSVEEEDHLLVCKNLKSEVKDDEVIFEFVYKDVKHQKRAVKVFKAVLRKREILMKYN